jgi:hypothetical protein
VVCTPTRDQILLCVFTRLYEILGSASRFDIAPQDRHQGHELNRYLSFGLVQQTGIRRSSSRSALILYSRAAGKLELRIKPRGILGCVPILGTRNDHLDLVRVHTLYSSRIHVRGHVIVCLSGLDRVVGIRCALIQRGADFGIRPARFGAAIHVIAGDCGSTRSPGEIYTVWRRRSAAAGERLQRWRV